ncbi:hypothetical protein PPL_06935 [Heterostelium album PN500]|uniref:Ribosomal protein mS38 C-terminal domain-containing protein n=1 Tax=Heterostelium pallidum (strain ATCC 26659 / Pp 5 / PN500) TaxID=670386 RepID=D3BDY2_HETP5|nr:hypothetical protein PPL_06935 [Heterostelium album PN500]EFA80113.1 hypothetical protein PPL_06935 [Heterostelium album PN500]|eukprot:XP_020432233.1 hypothetical protein PPL_06935 [Heterostelium album PN500]
MLQKGTLRCASSLFGKVAQPMTATRSFITDFNNANINNNLYNKFNKQTTFKSISSQPSNIHSSSSSNNSPLFCNTNDIFNLFPLNYKPLEFYQKKQQEEQIKVNRYDINSIVFNDEMMIDNGVKEEQVHESIEMSSIIKKRKLKMTKHKQRKLRKRMRSLKKRLGKI